MAYLVILVIFVALAALLRRWYLPLTACALCISFMVMQLDFAHALKRHVAQATEQRIANIEEATK